MNILMNKSTTPFIDPNLILSIKGTKKDGHLAKFYLSLTRRRDKEQIIDLFFQVRIKEFSFNFVSIEIILF